MRPNIFFVVLALAVTANSNTLTTSAANETSELAVDTTHGEGGKRLLRTSNRNTDILDEERIGASQSSELFDALRRVQSARVSLVNPFARVENNIIRILTRTSPETKKFIDNSNIDINQVLEKTQYLTVDPFHSVDGWEMNFYKALGGEYFSHISHFDLPDVPPTMNDPSRKNLQEMVADRTDYLKNNVGVDPVEVMKKAFWLHDNVETKLDNQKIFNMAYGGEYFAKNP